MQTINFIVHPEYAILSNDREAVEAYAKRIEEVAKSPRTYVITGNVFPMFRNEFEESIFQRIYSNGLVPHSRILTSNSGTIDGDYYPFGHINKESWAKIKSLFIGKITESEPKIRIHGCFFGDGCTQNLALQLHGYLTKGENWFDWEGNYSWKSLITDTLKIDVLELSKKLEKDQRIRYGVVYSTKTVGQKRGFRIIPRLLSSKSLDSQLTDSETMIFGK